MLSDRWKAILCGGLVPLCLSVTGPASSRDEPAGDYHGFVIYTWDENPSGWDHEIFPLARALGAGWIQAEGPLMLSESAHWGRLVPDPAADLSDPESYGFELLDWVGAARSEGLNVVLTLSTGNEREGWNTYSPWVQCDWTPQNALWEIGCNCLPRDWNQWYRFVYQVVSHFDEVPEPYDALAFDNPDCPKEIDIGRYLDLPPGTDLAVYRYTGELAHDGCTRDRVMMFDEAPFLVTWGDDTDGDCIPDVSDNCPETHNPDQLDQASVFKIDGGYLEAPDGLGNACQPRQPRRGGGRMEPRRDRDSLEK